MEIYERYMSVYLNIRKRDYKYVKLHKAFAIISIAIYRNI